MDNKIVKFGLGLGVFLILVVACGKLYEGYLFRQRQAEIDTLLRKLNSKGFVSDGDTFARSIPDSQNAWVETKPLLSKIGGPPPAAGNRNIDSQALLSYGTKSDLGIIESVLAKDARERVTIVTALRTKQHFVIPRNFNEGYMMQYPEGDHLKTLTNEICLEGLGYLFKGDESKAENDLVAAYMLGAELMDRKEPQARALAYEIYKIISKAELRRIEFRPDLLTPIRRISTIWNPKFDRSPLEILRWAFLSDVAMCRNFDDPVMDVPHLDGILAKLDNKYPKGKEFDAYYRLRPSDHKVESTAMRRCLVATLKHWDEATTLLMDPNTKASIKTLDKVTKLVRQDRQCPKPLDDRWNELYNQNLGQEGFMLLTLIDLKEEMFRQLEYLQMNGQPAKHLLGAIREEDTSVKYAVLPLKNGIQIGGGDVGPDGLAVRRFCYPPAAGLPVNNTSLETVVRMRKRAGILK